MRVRLTQDFINNDLAVPEGRDRVELLDDQTENFFVEVRASNPGKGTFWVRYRDPSGTTRYVKVGKTTELTLAEARGKAKEIKASIALGADPRGDINARRKMMTVAELYEKHVLPHSKAHKRSYARDLEMYKLRIRPEFGHVRICDVSRRSVQIFHARLVEDGLKPATADLYAKCIRWAMSLAVEYQFIGSKPISQSSSYSIRIIEKRFFWMKSNLNSSWKCCVLTRIELSVRSRSTSCPAAAA